MAQRIEVKSKIRDTRAEIRKKRISELGFDIEDVVLTDAYTLDDDSAAVDLEKVAQMLTNPVTQLSTVNSPSYPKRFDYAVEIGFLPGVTDNVGTTGREMIEDYFDIDLEGQGVYSSQVMFLRGDLTRDQASKIGDAFSNPLIQRKSVKNFDEFIRDRGMDVIVPRVRLDKKPVLDLVNILEASDQELALIGKQGIANSDGSRRGPLSMDLAYMQSVRDYFARSGREPTDLELESIAQTWSEHCKHTIFADPIDEFKDGLFRHFIKRATVEVRAQKEDRDFCVSVFTDNAGGIIFDDDFLVCDKVETHNSPSALDPFGGAITGIVGVNRDAMGFGMGAKPVANRYGFCFGNQNSTEILYKRADKSQRMLSSRRIMDGVIEGVNVGGNCSGIPTPQGFFYFDPSYRGKPLVFVGTVGLIPRKKDGRNLHEKRARSGDYIVMVGGRVGKDGIHGATFSSEAIDSGSPATAVQIGDPITQKKLSDAIVKEARDRELYHSITDNGAGGLSCSVAEMAKESGGFYVRLEKVPLKYSGLAPWEIWISESQERMTLAVPHNKWQEFSDLMTRRGVESTIIGEFTDSGKCIVDYEGQRVMDLDMDFLHNGLPKREIITSFRRITHEEPTFECLDDLTDSLFSMLRRNNIASFEFISQQYDHEVQGGSVIKPLQGRGRINGDATVVRPRPDSNKAVVLSQGINPSYSAIDTYNMAACAIDTAIRNVVAAGADLEHLALLDNFCWCSSNEPERLAELKRACEACYDCATQYRTPFISGKDSMFNDFKGFNENGEPIKISVLPTLLISSIGVIKDAGKAVSIDSKFPGDLVYVLGTTYNELGGSEYFAMRGKERGEKFIGNKVPQANVNTNRDLYFSLSRAINKMLVASAISVHRGGLGVALAKTAMAGQLGMDVELEKIPNYCERDDFALYSESQGRIVVTVNPMYRTQFEEEMGENSFALVGKVREDSKFRILKNNKNIVDTTIDKITESYKSTFKDF